LIRRHYIEPVEPENLYQGSIKGMVESLDEFSTYISPEDADKFEDRIMGQRCSLGVVLELDGDEVKVVGCLPKSPSAKAGLVGGDVVLAIDEQEVKGLTLDQVQDLLIGEAGDKFDLTILKPTGREIELRVALECYPIESITGLCREAEGRWIHLIDPENGLGYMRVREFVQKTSEHFHLALRQVGELKGLVLDLRGNPGGLLNSATEVADMFLSDGVIVKAVTRNKSSKTYQAHGGGSCEQIPLIVLVDSDTASAAEIVAGAIKLSDRGVLVGTRTRGKGCVQSMFPLSGNLGKLSLTTSEFFLANDQPITKKTDSDSWGVEPHEQVVTKPQDLEILGKIQASVELLSVIADVQDRADPDKIRREILRRDKQLARALELLREPEKMADIIEAAAIQRTLQEKDEDE